MFKKRSVILTIQFPMTVWILLIAFVKYNWSKTVLLWFQLVYYRSRKFDSFSPTLTVLAVKTITVSLMKSCQTTYCWLQYWQDNLIYKLCTFLPQSGPLRVQGQVVAAGGAHVGVDS